MKITEVALQRSAKKEKDYSAFLPNLGLHPSPMGMTLRSSRLSDVQICRQWYSMTTVSVVQSHSNVTIIELIDLYGSVSMAGRDVDNDQCARPHTRATFCVYLTSRNITNEIIMQIRL